jgi:hypothetical protein
VLEVTSHLGSNLHMDPSSNRMIQRHILHQTLTSKNFLTYATKSWNKKFRHTYLYQRGLIEHTVLNPSVEIWFCISPHKPRAGGFLTRENMNQRKLHSI